MRALLLGMLGAVFVEPCPPSAFGLDLVKLARRPCLQLPALKSRQQRRELGFDLLTSGVPLGLLPRELLRKTKCHVVERHRVPWRVSPAQFVPYLCSGS